MSSRFQTRGDPTRGSAARGNPTRPHPRSQSAVLPGVRLPVDHPFRMPSAALAFAAAFLRNPRRVGAVAPASRWLAEAVGRQLDGCACDTLIEVGPGTGAITRVLNERRSAFSRVLAVERDEWMVSVLRARYADLEIVHGCASELTRHVRVTSPVAIVSSLPFKSLPEDTAAGCIRALVDTLDSGPGSMLLQYTYGLSNPPFELPAARFAWSRVDLVMRNLPPATIWRLEHNPQR